MKNELYVFSMKWGRVVIGFMGGLLLLAGIFFLSVGLLFVLKGYVSFSIELLVLFSIGLLAISIGLVLLKTSVNRGKAKRCKDGKSISPIK